MSLKEAVREVLLGLHLDYSRNLRYDRLTRRIMKKALKPDSNCVDVGCHKGEILRRILRHSPQGSHFAFEPLPDYFKLLQKEFGNICTVYPYALSDTEGESDFQFVKNAPAYSGLKKRRYDTGHPDIEKIQVKMQRLDALIPQDIRIDFIKIDVEGGEFGVLKGAVNTIRRSSPVIVFECGMGGSDYYGTKPSDVYRFLTGECGLTVNLLQHWPTNTPPLSEAGFVKAFEENTDYYFVAWKAV
jgi:FkbM family methyltransferase